MVRHRLLALTVGALAIGIVGTLVVLRSNRPTPSESHGHPGDSGVTWELLERLSTAGLPGPEELERIRSLISEICTLEPALAGWRFGWLLSHGVKWEEARLEGLALHTTACLCRGYALLGARPGQVANGLAVRIVCWLDRIVAGRAWATAEPTSIADADLEEARRTTHAVEAAGFSGLGLTLRRHFDPRSRWGQQPPIAPRGDQSDVVFGPTATRELFLRLVTAESPAGSVLHGWGRFREFLAQEPDVPVGPWTDAICAGPDEMAQSVPRLLPSLSASSQRAVIERARRLTWLHAIATPSSSATDASTAWKDAWSPSAVDSKYSGTTVARAVLSETDASARRTALVGCTKVSPYLLRRQADLVAALHAVAHNSPSFDGFLAWLALVRAGLDSTTERAAPSVTDAAGLTDAITLMGQSRRVRSLGELAELFALPGPSSVVGVRTAEGKRAMTLGELAMTAARGLREDLISDATTRPHGALRTFSRCEQCWASGGVLLELLEHGD